MEHRAGMRPKMNAVRTRRAGVTPRWLRLLDWLERHTTGAHSWPWARVWMRRGWSFHFASGDTGFFVGLPLPRWLPGFVRPDQEQELRTRAGRRESDLHLVVPLFPPGWPHAFRSRRMRGRT